MLNNETFSQLPKNFDRIQPPKKHSDQVLATIESVDHNQDNFEVTRPIVIQMILPNKKKSQKSDRASGSPKVRDQVVGI